LAADSPTYPSANFLRVHSDTAKGDQDMTIFYAQPYDVSASGFYFATADEFHTKSDALRNQYGQPVEEFEIQFIDGDQIDAELFEVLSVHQGDIAAFIEATETWSYDEKTRTIIAVSECGYRFALGTDDQSRFDIDPYELSSFRDLAIQFVDDGLLGSIPDALICYIDYDALARDLQVDYSQTTVDSVSYIYRCG
jgi:antirestriction protein